MHALGLEFGSAAQLSKRPGSVWNCLWGNALKRSPGIIRKSRVSYPGPGFLSSATWPSLPKKHYNGLNQTKPNQISHSWKHLNQWNFSDIYLQKFHPSCMRFIDSSNPHWSPIFHFKYGRVESCQGMKSNLHIIIYYLKFEKAKWHFKRGWSRNRVVP